jgi:hypothetical protein
MKVFAVLAVLGVLGVLVYGAVIGFPSDLLRSESPIDKIVLTMQEDAATRVLEIDNPELIEEIERSLRNYRRPWLSGSGGGRFLFYCEYGSRKLEVSFSKDTFGSYGPTPPVLRDIIEFDERDGFKGWR